VSGKTHERDVDGPLWGTLRGGAGECHDLPDASSGDGIEPPRGSASRSRSTRHTGTLGSAGVPATVNGARSPRSTSSGQASSCSLVESARPTRSQHGSEPATWRPDFWRVLTYFQQAGRWMVIRSLPYSSRFTARTDARRVLSLFLITNQRAIAGVVNPRGEVVWQGRAERGDLQHDPIDSKASRGRVARRSAAGPGRRH
jgi:hypothetical protein